MKKTIITMAGAAFLATGAVAVTPVPASAWIPFVYPMMQAQYNPNFKAVNPYDKPARHAKRSHKRAKKM
jgi:hypothetical protein